MKAHNLTWAAWQSGYQGNGTWAWVHACNSQQNLPSRPLAKSVLCA